MARTTSKRIMKSRRALIDRLEKNVARAYAESVRDLRDGVNITELAEAIKEKDVNRAIRALNIEEAAFAPLRRALEESFIASGSLTASLTPWRKRRGT